MKPIRKRRGTVFSFLLLLCSFTVGCGSTKTVYLTSEETETAEEVSSLERTTEKAHELETGSFCCVYVCGEVASPGVYTLPDNSRIYEALELAGGVLDTAALESLNQAETIEDGQMIRVLSKDEAQAGQSEAVEEKDDRIHINTATAEELMTLPGIGQAKADSIIAYRTKNGKFSSVEDIKKIEGIKEGVYSKIKDRITVN